MPNQIDGELGYESSQAVESAIAEAASKAVKLNPLKTKSEYIAFVHQDRLMCRIFSDGENSRWVLKGGNGMLARIPNARSTRDIDVVTDGTSAEEAIEDLITLAKVDLGDFFYFTHVKTDDILESENQPNLQGKRIAFNVRLGVRNLGSLKVDLVVSPQIPTSIESMQPLHRLSLPKLVTHDFRLWPIENQIADKVCATLQTYSRDSSSRSKDLFDLLAIAQTQVVQAEKLSTALADELAGRNLSMGDVFRYPSSWWAQLNIGFKNHIYLARFKSDGEAGNVLNRFLFPPVELGAKAVWNPNLLYWEAIAG
jgi:hypothetical protein